LETYGFWKGGGLGIIDFELWNMKYFKFLLLILCIVYSCRQEKQEVLRIAAAASVQYVLKALIEDFESRDSVKVQSIISSSGKLTAQITQGAPYDLFLSADTSYPGYLYRIGKGSVKPKIYGYGKLVLWSCREIENELNLEILKDEKIKKIALPDPATAPYGILAEKVLKDAGIDSIIQDKIVLGESISQVNQYIATKTVDIGFSSLSVVLASKLKNTGNYTRIKGCQMPHSMLLLQNSEKIKDSAQRFYKYMQSPEAFKILHEYGLGK
jgi:molybdate transport system substrate-binding protein